MPIAQKNYQELPGLWVSIDKVEYCPEANTPRHRPHQFAYYITIHNDSLNIVTIMGRKWIVTNNEGHRLIVEGDGVVGQFPRLVPGDQFHYNSYHLLDSTSTAEGAYLGKDEDDNPVLTKIPRFAMNIHK
ncbi:MAG: ApaG domain [Verrucomicrobiota bacterium]